MIELTYVQFGIFVSLTILSLVLSLVSNSHTKKLKRLSSYWEQESHFWEDSYGTMRSHCATAEELLQDYKDHSHNLLKVTIELWEKHYGETKSFPIELKLDEFPSRASDEGLALCEYGYDDTLP